MAAVTPAGDAGPEGCFADPRAALTHVLASLAARPGLALVTGPDAVAVGVAVEAAGDAGLAVEVAPWPPGPPGPAAVAALVVVEPPDTAAPGAGGPAPLAAQVLGAARARSAPLVLHRAWATPLDLAAEVVAGADPGASGRWPSAELDTVLEAAGAVLVAAAEVIAPAALDGAAPDPPPPAVPSPGPPSGPSGGGPGQDSPRAVWAAALAATASGPGSLRARTAAYLPSGADRALVPRSAGDGPAFLSVVVRTQGRRLGQLREALLCLSAQTDDDLELLVALHATEASGAAGAAVAAVQDVLDDLPARLRARARLLEVRGGGRGRPLNVALAHAQGRYVAFLDDDDLVTADWAEAFRAGADARPGAVVRSRSARQEVRAVPGPVGYEPVSPYTVPYRAAFDYGDHLVANQSPICSVALPRHTLATFGVRVDESLAALEDWDLLLRTVPWCGVVDTGLVTSIYHYWVDESGSAGVEGGAAWAEARRRVLEGASRRVLVALPEVAADLVAQPDVAEAARQRAFSADAARHEADARLEALHRSRYWRATRPLQRGVGLVRRARALLRDRSMRSAPRP